MKFWTKIFLPSKEKEAEDTEDKEWTDGDTSEMMGLMEIALEKMQNNLFTTLNEEMHGRAVEGGEAEGEVDVEAEVRAEVEQLEDNIKAAKTDTFSVVQDRVQQ